jgi:hypothetical protein
MCTLCRNYNRYRKDIEDRIRILKEAIEIDANDCGADCCASSELLLLESVRAALNFLGVRKEEDDVLD